jgi:hypothetical protein
MGLNWSILFTALQKKVTQVSHCICSGSLMQSFCHFNACFWEEFHQECHLLPRHRARLLHNEQLNPAKAGFEMYGRFQFCRIFAPFYGNVPFKKAPNLHAWTSEAEIPKYRLLRCSLFRNRPLCLSWCLFWVTAEGLCHFSACGGLGEPLAPFLRNGEQGGGAFPRSQQGLKWPDRELWNDRRDTRKAFSFQN